MRAGQVVDDDPQVRNRRAQRFDPILRIGCTSADDVERHPSCGEVTQIP